jgi:opacity protein-like surface antigen
MKTGAFLVCICLLAGTPVDAADTPTLDLAGGYSFMHDEDRDKDFKVGWFVTVGGNVNSWFAAVAEIGGSYATCKACTLGPFAQVLVGGSHVSGGIEWVGAMTTATSVQPGGGIDINLSPKWGVRVQGDYRLIHVGHGSFATPNPAHIAKETRFVVGLVYNKSTTP